MRFNLAVPHHPFNRHGSHTCFLPRSAASGHNLDFVAIFTLLLRGRCFLSNLVIVLPSEPLREVLRIGSLLPSALTPLLPLFSSPSPTSFPHASHLRVAYFVVGPIAASLVAPLSNPHHAVARVVP